MGGKTKHSTHLQNGLDLLDQFRVSYQKREAKRLLAYLKHTEIVAQIGLQADDRARFEKLENPLHGLLGETTQDD